MNIHELKLDSKNKIAIDIIALKEIGLSHKDISIKLNCSKSTVSYYCNKNVSIKYSERINRNKASNESTYRFQKSLNMFKSSGKGTEKNMSKDWNAKIRTSVAKFKKKKHYE